MSWDNYQTMTENLTGRTHVDRPRGCFHCQIVLKEITSITVLPLVTVISIIMSSCCNKLGFI